MKKAFSNNGLFAYTKLTPLKLVRIPETLAKDVEEAMHSRCRCWNEVLTELGTLDVDEFRQISGFSEV